MAHNQLVNVLHRQCLEKDSLIAEEIRRCRDSGKALLLQEVRVKNNINYDIEYLFIDSEKQHISV